MLTPQTSSFRATQRASALVCSAGNFVSLGAQREIRFICLTLKKQIPHFVRNDRTASLHPSRNLSWRSIGPSLQVGYLEGSR